MMCVLLQRAWIRILNRVTLRIFMRVVQIGSAMMTVSCETVVASSVILIRCCKGRAINTTG